LAQGNVELQVIYWKADMGGNFDPGFGRHVKWNVDLYSNYEWWTPSSSTTGSIRKLNRVLSRLNRFNPSAVICFGWSSPVALAGLAYGKLARRPTLLYSDTNGRQMATTLRGRLRKPAIRLILSRISGAVSTGAANTEFYTSHGMKASRIYPGTLPIALDSFYHAGLRQRDTPEFDDGHRPLVIGFAGKLLPHKGVDELIRAVSTLPRDLSWRLQIVGDGPEKSALEKLVNWLSLAEHVEFTGFKNTDEIPDLLAAMDIFVMPSRKEPRGLVAIEAMAAGTVPIVSSATGVWGEGDAVQDGITGYVYVAGDTDDLALKIRRLIGDPQLRRQLSERARGLAQNFGPKAFAENVVDAVSAAIHR
jgi:glycosyltransferase involved in cell wall biosynthesis